MTAIQAAKATVRSFRQEFDQFTPQSMSRAAQTWWSDSYFWRGMHPFCDAETSDAVLERFWLPLTHALTSMTRREDIFFAGENDVDGGESVWVCSMGHFMGLFDHAFLGIPATGRMAFLRYAEFSRIKDGKIQESALFCDLLGLMEQAGCYPLPPMTGAHFVYPSPATHDGILNTPNDPSEAKATLAVVNAMIDDLRRINALEDFRCPPEVLRKCWHEDMIWYGPCGIGATYTISRYQEQHQHPFRLNLADKTYNGHISRFAEGHYCAFFGWANLSNRNTGGFLGLPAAREASEMRIVDVYRRRDDKLAENWVIIDLPHYLAQQGLDVFERLKELRRFA